MAGLGEKYRTLGESYREGRAMLEGNMTPAEKEAARKRKKYEDEAAAERKKHEGKYAAPTNAYSRLFGGK